MKANEYKDAPKTKDVPRDGSSNGLEKSAYEVLGGTFLTRKRAIQLLPFMLYLALLALIYIGNTYYTERKIRRMDDLRDELKELRYEYISTKSTLMGQKKQSTLINYLEEDGVKASTIPPKKIFIED